ncbi:MAG: YbhB/YbcL family Raf kinase inhibitor-like protein [Gammaproteobacteria bacterium]|nr:YbhB/YbcL family Raf kinase inhibitor-like protein [Gammaproteobacteria bacterium]MDH3509401.1 YbhB/YbcL family Raf kinase inhibitor-like protein [Gammaproteobacteria bacterium]
MQLTSTSFADNARIPDHCAFGNPDPAEHMRLGANRNPQLSWSGVPEAAKSLVLLCIDPDVPSSAENINQEGKKIPADLPRVDFCHWAMVDIAPLDSSIAEGSCSDGVTARGKKTTPGPENTRQGINDYTGFMAGDADMGGEYFGYDGPCPPWNDERLHHYHFILYATDLVTCPVQETFTATDVKRAIDSHILAEARLVGTYSLNPEVR